MTPELKHNIQCGILFAIGTAMALAASLPQLAGSQTFLTSAGFALAAIALPQIRRPQ